MTLPSLSERTLSAFPYFQETAVDPSFFDSQDNQNLAQDTKRVRRKTRRRKTFNYEAENQPATDSPKQKKQKKEQLGFMSTTSGRPSRSTQYQAIEMPCQAEAFLNTDIAYTSVLDSDYSFNIEETFLKSPTYRPLYTPLSSDATPTKRSVHGDIYMPLTKGFLGLHDEIQALLSPLIIPPIDPDSPSPSADTSPRIPFNSLSRVRGRVKAKASA
uniref:Uncharacterized protein n=1 Tax=Moniliophthora roreri TaxID=221103 RepID=A0A0W0FU53_MONRR